MLKITSHSPDPWKGYFGYHLLSSWFITSLFPIFYSFLQIPIISSSPPTSQSSAHPKSSMEEGALVSVTLLSTSEKSRDWPHSPQSDQTAPRPAGHLKTEAARNRHNQNQHILVPLASSYILCSNGRVTCWTWFHGPGQLKPLQQCGGSRLLGGWNWETPKLKACRNMEQSPNSMEICSWENHETQWWLFRQAMVDEKRNYFTSCDPHHDIYTFSYWQIFWHSIWHIFWHSIWHIFWHMFWHIFWHIFWHSIWQIFWHSIWHIFWHSIWHSIWHIFWHFFWHSIWHIFWHYIWHIFWHSFWHIFWHSVWHIFWHSFWRSFWHSIWHIFWHSIWHLRGWGPAVPTAIWKSRLRSGSDHWDLELAVEVRQCPLGSGARGWGPAVPTATWKSRLRSGSAHWDLELAVEVRQCPLGSGARGGGLAVPTGIWTARRRRRVRRWRRRSRTALIKSNNPHLAGGEKHHLNFPDPSCHSSKTTDFASEDLAKRPANQRLSFSPVSHSK